MKRPPLPVLLRRGVKVPGSEMYRPSLRPPYRPHGQSNHVWEQKIAARVWMLGTLLKNRFIAGRDIKNHWRLKKALGPGFAALERRRLPGSVAAYADALDAYLVAFIEAEGLLVGARLITLGNSQRAKPTQTG